MLTIGMKVRMETEQLGNIDQYRIMRELPMFYASEDRTK